MFLLYPLEKLQKIDELIAKANSTALSLVNLPCSQL